MFRRIQGAFTRGLKKIKDNPQLVYTIVVAVIIFFAFIFMTDRFMNIALSAQERLINVRIGSIQDTLSQFVVEKIDDPAYLETKLQAIKNSNETIQDFRILVPKENGMTIIASLNPNEHNQIDKDNSFLYNLAAADPNHSYTQEYSTTERFYKTVRALTNASGTIAAYTYTSQSLSEADRAINNDIRNSIILFSIVIIVIMFLFFRHAKIIDYTTLYAKLQDIDKMKDDFVAMASHELKTPLTIIRGYAEFLGDSKSITPEDQKYVKSINNATENLSLLVEDILDVSRLAQGRMKFNFQKVDVDPLIQDVVTAMQGNAAKKNLTLTADLHAGLALADQDRLRQILINLIGNAIKYTLEGSVTVKSSVTSDNKITIRISDTGLGISAAEQKNLFQRFYRVSTPETSKISGTGLGLWITREIVRNMNGTISLESIEGVGSHFIVTLPQAK